MARKLKKMGRIALWIILQAYYMNWKAPGKRHLERLRYTLVCWNAMVGTLNKAAGTKIGMRCILYFLTGACDSLRCHGRYVHFIADTWVEIRMSLEKIETFMMCTFYNITYFLYSH